MKFILNLPLRKVQLLTSFLKSCCTLYTSNKGCCGGAYSYISCDVRDMVKELEAQGKEADIVVGEKCRSQMWRTVGDHITCAATYVVAPGSYKLALTLLT